MASSYSENERKYMREMAKSILLLATLVATATYAAGFSPPGGVWPQETAGHLPGDPIIRSTQYVRYLMFFYCNATAFASSFMVVVLTILLIVARRQANLKTIVIPLLLVTLVGLLSLIGAYASGTFRDVFTAVFTSMLLAAVFTYLIAVSVPAYFRSKGSNIVVVASLKERCNREVLMQLATFALTVTYGSGLSTPGGFWDSTDGGNLPGDAILKGARPTVFFVCNTMAFVASLLMILVLLLRMIRHMMTVYVGSVVLLFGLLGSYLAGSCQETDTSIYMASLVGVVVAYIIFLAVTTSIGWPACNRGVSTTSQLQGLTSEKIMDIVWKKRENLAYSIYYQYLATLALTVTYVAGLHPPGGLWQDDGDGHKAGDPILQTTNPRRYNAFFYCNSVAFVASLVCMILVQLKPVLRLRALEQAMILDLLGLVGSYAFGSCRAETTTVYTMGISGATVVYVVLHVALLDDREPLRQLLNPQDYPPPDNSKKIRSLDMLGFGYFLFALFIATIAYQAGLTPPGGFLLKDDESGNHAGDPVLLHNYPRRYRVFFYCNSASFMVSIAVIILLVNHKLYRPAIETKALSVCTAVSFFCLLAAFAAGTTQHLDTSIYILVLLAVVFCSAVLLILLFFLWPFIFSWWASYKRKYNANLTISISSEGNAQVEEDPTADNAIGSSAPANAADVANPSITTSSEGNAQAEEDPTTDDAIGSSAPANAADVANPPVTTSSEGNAQAEEDPTADDAIGSSAPANAADVANPPITTSSKGNAQAEEDPTVDDAIGSLSPANAADVANPPIPTSSRGNAQAKFDRTKKTEVQAKRMYMMTVGILVAGVTYQAGLDPPGGSWSKSSHGHDAGSPVMHTNRRQRYLLFFLSNSASFVASIFLMLMLLPSWTDKPKKPLLIFMNTMLLLGFLGFLGAYATGSNREWEASFHVVVIFFSVLAYFSSLLGLSLFLARRRLRHAQPPVSLAPAA